MPFKKVQGDWNKRGGRKGYSVEVLEGKMSKEEFKARGVGDNIHLIGNKATRMLRKAINEGLKEHPDLNMLATELYDLAEDSGWDKKKLDRTYKLLEKCNNIAIKELAVRASSFVVDKLVPDKIEPRRAEGIESVEKLRESLFGLIRGVGKGIKGRAAIIVETDGSGIEEPVGHSRHKDPSGFKPDDSSVGRLEGEKADRLLRAGGNSAGELPQESVNAPGVSGREHGGENDNGGD